VRTADTPKVFTQLAPLWSERKPFEDVGCVARKVVAVLRSGGHVLDIGCGTGEHLSAVRREAHRRGKRIGRTVGVDLAEGMAAEAGKRRAVRTAAGDALSLPFGDQVFDVVVCNHVLHFVDDPERAAREMVRVLRPGGTIVAGLRASGKRTDRAGVNLDRLPPHSLLRRYLALPRRGEVGAFRRELAALGCEVGESTGPRVVTDRSLFLARVAAASGTPEDLAAAGRLVRRNGAHSGLRFVILQARAPGPRNGGMPIRVQDLPGWTPTRVRRLIDDLPKAYGYEVVVKPLWWRSRPHVQAWCEFEEKRITIQVPVPFAPFAEEVPYRAERLRAKGLRFRWYSTRLRFQRPNELIRYLYLHEYYHWYLREVLGRKSAAETACDRFALQHL
jgi:SAM-dependent methyltransferase